MKISFVILTWNRAVFLKKCLPALLGAIDKKEQCEIIIMDNCSNDDSLKYISEFQKENTGKINLKVIESDKNLGINAYKKLFSEAKGEYIIEVDDDVIEFPPSVDDVFIDYFQEFKKFGFLALDVIKNEYTNGSKPDESQYTEYRIGNKIVQNGPTGGWCAGFRRKHFNLIKFFFYRYNLNFKFGEDGFIQLAFKIIGLKSGIIKDVKCLHASGPEYSKMFNLTKRDIEKYESSGMGSMADKYK